MTRNRFSATVSAMALVVTLSACGGGDGASQDEAETPITLDDLKPTPDDFFPGFDAPNDLEVPEEYDSVATTLGDGLSGILRISLEEPETWKLATDEDVARAVTLGFGAIGEDNSTQLADFLLSKEQEEAAEGERLATRFASTFAPDAQPTDMFVYKLKWDASVDEGSGAVTISAVAWAGYEVDGRVVIAAREFALSGVEEGTNVTYTTDQPRSGGLYDLCASVVDGVLMPPADGISKAQATSLREEFADQGYTPLLDSFLTDEAEGVQEERSRKVEDCLAKG